MDRARHQFLADAAFAFEQHRNSGGGGLFRRVQHRLHRRGAGNDIGQSQRAVAAAPDALQFAGQRLGGERVAQRDFHAFGAGRLDHEVGGAGAHRRDDIIDAAVGGLDNDRGVEAGLAHPRHHAEAVEVRHHQIEHDAVDRGGLIAGEQGEGGVAAFGGQRPVAETLDHGFNQPTLNRIVIDDQHNLRHEHSKATEPGAGKHARRYLCRFGAVSVIRLNGPLNAAVGAESGQNGP